MWLSELVDIREAELGDGSGQDIYIKISNSTILTRDEKKSHLIVTLPIVFVVVLITFALILYAWRKKKKPHDKGEGNKSFSLKLPCFHYLLYV
uniref:Uncharacterized protein n=1 Tax=Helianthus annuus TaxID=4232 RepID=A0A251SLQ2_HELAN